MLMRGTLRACRGCHRGGHRACPTACRPCRRLEPRRAADRPPKPKITPTRCRSWRVPDALRVQPGPSLPVGVQPVLDDVRGDSRRCGAAATAGAPRGPWVPRTCVAVSTYRAAPCASTRWALERATALVCARQRLRPQAVAAGRAAARAATPCRPWRPGVSPARSSPDLAGTAPGPPV